MSTTLTSTLPGINAVVAAIHTAGRSECDLADPVIIASDTLPKLRFESLTDVTGWEAYGLLCLSQPDHWMSGHLTCVRGYILGAAVGLDADHDTYVLVEYPTPLPQRVPGANLDLPVEIFTSDGLRFVEPFGAAANHETALRLIAESAQLGGVR